MPKRRQRLTAPGERSAGMDRPEAGIFNFKFKDVSATKKKAWLTKSQTRLR